MNSVFKRYLVVIVISFSCIDFTTSISLQEELTISHPQKLALDKFREIMKSRLPHAYMVEDIYLIKWLRAQNFDVKKSERMLMKNLKWREDNKMDTIHQEDWSDMEEDYPIRIDGFDKQGQPVLTGDVGEWNLRRAFISGRLERILRYIDKMLDAATIMIREMQAEGKNVTRFIFIENLENFNLAEHTCAPCTARLLQFLSSFENHFPGSCDKAILINVAPLFEFVLHVVRSTVSQRTQGDIHVFGKNRQQWEKYLLELIDKDQLSREYGGTKRV